MLALTLAVQFLAGLALAAPAITPATPTDDPAAVVIGDDTETDDLPALPLRWTTRFGESLSAGSTLKLEWHGGDENGHEVYYVPRWPGQLQYDFVTIETNTTSREIEWQIPELAEYPKGTEFIFGVKDGSRGPGFDWYDLSASIPLK